MGFVGVGQVDGVGPAGDDCTTTPVVAAIVMLDTGAIAAVRLLPACSAALGVPLHPTMFRLEGNWEEGFRGVPLELGPVSWLRFGPFHEGMTVVEGCYLCGLASVEFSFEGPVQSAV